MEDDERREAAIASLPCLNTKSKPSSAASQARLSKFQVSRSYGPGKLEEKDNEAEPYKTTKDNSSSISLDNHQENVPAQMASKKPQKLHWGLDTKERWERKSNM
ncbi:hypothetical protein HanHA300_Chr14g0522241 [Helianthus annuus]|nr:hypothetical protein HanHA300_Chr14g0522241 [Helianthus annuus]KAJ0659773.1 hypothetical protein HanOQP8_Chr14g0530001 [Helianthus annuus]